MVWDSRYLNDNEKEENIVVWTCNERLRKRCLETSRKPDCGWKKGQRKTQKDMEKVEDMKAE